MEFDWTSGKLAEGLACYERAEFFETHEHWEIVWLALAEPEKSFLQALIQVAAGFHHLRAGNSAGGVSLLRRALRRFEGCPEGFCGIAIASLREEVREALRDLEAEAPLDLKDFPRICPTKRISPD